MDTLLNIDWRGAFVPTVSIIEIIMRGSLIYLALFAIMRFVLKREAGTIGLADLLVVEAIRLRADRIGNAFSVKMHKAATLGLLTLLRKHL